MPYNPLYESNPLPPPSPWCFITIANDISLSKKKLHAKLCMFFHNMPKIIIVSFHSTKITMGIFLSLYIYIYTHICSWPCHAIKVVSVLNGYILLNSNKNLVIFSCSLTLNIKTMNGLSKYGWSLQVVINASGDCEGTMPRENCGHNRSRS